MILNTSGAIGNSSAMMQARFSDSDDCSNIRRQVGRKSAAWHVYKSVPCKFFQRGYCANGESCAWAHSERELRSRPDLTCTSLCKNIVQYGVCNVVDCRFAHTADDLVATSCCFKTRMCTFAESGLCRNGDNCRFAHHPDELRPPERAAYWTNVYGEQSNDKGTNGGRVINPDAGLPTDLPTKTAKPAVHEEVDGNQQGQLGSSRSQARQRQKQQQQQQQQRGAVPKVNFFHESSCNRSGYSGSKSSGSAYDTTYITDEKKSVEDDGSWSREGSSQDSSGPTAIPRSESTAGSNNSGDNEETQGNRASSGKQGANGADDLATTTWMVKNLPTFFTQCALLAMFEDLTPEFKNKCDFFYCPFDKETAMNLGYAIINFPDSAVAARFQQEWSGKSLVPIQYGGGGRSGLRIFRAECQGFRENYKFYCRNLNKNGIHPSFYPILHPTVQTKDEERQPNSPVTGKGEDPDAGAMTVQVFDMKNGEAVEDACEFADTSNVVGDDSSGDYF